MQTVRRISAEEVQLESFKSTLADLPEASFSWTYAAFLQEIRESIAWGLWDEVTLCSVACLRSLGDGWDLTLCLTRKELQGRGQMPILLGGVLQNLESEAEHVRVWLEVHERNHSAIRLYHQLGFRQVGRRGNYYKDGGAALLFEYVS